MAKPKAFVSLEDVSIEAFDRSLMGATHGRVLFKELSWEMRENEQWAILGPNGSGKSVLAEVIAGTHPVTKGKIVYHFPQDKIAYVNFDSQKSALGDGAFLQDRWNIGLREDAPSVSDFLSIPILRNKTKYRDVIRDFGLQPLLKRKLIELSNGERRKVWIARALLKNPRLLILDNPFEGLDEDFRKELPKILTRLMKGHITLAYVAAEATMIPAGVTHILRIDDDGSVSYGTRKEMLGSGKRERMLPKSTKGRKSIGRILVQMKNVNVSYSGVQILRDINWTVRERERWALFGPNGSGKTTLLSLILADNPQAYANDIMLFGKKRGTGESIWEIKKSIGWVSPELQLYYPHGATCLDIVCSGWFDSIGLYRNATVDQREIALAWLQRFGLAEHAATPLAELSEGEQRLVLLARALVKNPTLLILDEPCQGLDTAYRTRVLEAIDWVAKQHNAAMIYVTHRADELPKSITNILRLDKKQPRSSI